MNTLPSNRSFVALQRPKTSLTCCLSTKYNSFKQQLENKLIVNRKSHRTPNNIKPEQIMRNESHQKAFKAINLQQSTYSSINQCESTISSHKKSNQLSLQSTVSYLESSQSSQKMSIQNFSSFKDFQKQTPKNLYFLKQKSYNIKKDIHKHRPHHPIIIEQNQIPKTNKITQKQHLIQMSRNNNQISIQKLQNYQIKNSIRQIDLNNRKTRSQRMVRPLSLVTPSMLLRTVTPHKIVRSNTNLPVVGGYHMNQKDKRSVTRQMSPSKKLRPLSVKIVEVTKSKSYLPQVIKITLGQSQYIYDVESKNNLNKTNQSFNAQKDIRISMYKSPATVIFPSQLMKGPKLCKNHVQRIVAQGKLLKVSQIFSDEQGQNQENKQSTLTPLQKYFIAKNKLNVTENFQSTVAKSKISRIQQNEAELTSRSCGQFNLNTSQIQQQQISQAKKFETKQENQMFIDYQITQKILIQSCSLTNSRYSTRTLQSSLQRDLNELRKRKGLPDINPVWHSLLK